MSKPMIGLVFKVPRNWLLRDVGVSCTGCTHDRCDHESSLTELIENLENADDDGDDDDDDDGDDDDDDDDGVMKTHIETNGITS